MLGARLQRSLRCLGLRRRQQSTLSTTEEYTAEPQYPEILDLSRDARKEREYAAFCERIKAVRTVEEKQIKLNMPRYYGFKMVMFDDKWFPYNVLNCVQHCTRTHLVQADTLPAFYDQIDVGQVVEEIKGEIEEIIVMEHEGYMRQHEFDGETLEPDVLQDLKTKSLVTRIDHCIRNKLSRTLPHLQDVEVDFDPRHEAFWYITGLDPPKETVQSRRGWKNLSEERIVESIDRPAQYLGKPALCLRSELPLRPIVPYGEAVNPDLEVPTFRLDPRTVGFLMDRRHGTNIPGFWPGARHEFGLVSFSGRGCALRREPAYDDATDSLHCHGILASFGWLMAQANYLGFNAFNDLTYPLVTQTVLTDGRDWSIYVYQMNASSMRTKPGEPAKRNICWTTAASQRLYEEVRGGRAVALNDRLLADVLKLYANEPQVREYTDMRPFLHAEERIVAQIGDAEKRAWLDKIYKHLMSNRPRARLPPEVYLWEKIYKIDHKTRPMERRSRPFEVFEAPWRKPLNAHTPPYVPKKLRSGGPKDRIKFEKTYYPTDD